MADIVDSEEVDKDTVEPDALRQLFDKEYDLLAETAVSLEQSYAHKLHGSSALKVAVGIANNNSIDVYDLNTTLTKVRTYEAHSKPLTEVVFCPNDENLLYSAGLDGLVKLWDLRDSSSKCSQNYTVVQQDELDKPFECFDVSSNGRVLCAGSQLVKDNSFLVFWDKRVSDAIGGYWCSHTDDITQVKFHKDKPYQLASGSLDGLINIFNVAEQKEDDALSFSLNVENAIDKLTWLDTKQVACTTQSNDLQIWDSETGDVVKSYSRNKIAKSIKRSREDDCYLVDTYMSCDNTPVVLAGSNGGNGDVLRSLEITESRLQPSSNFSQNKQIVRCCWYNNDRDILVTCGESGIVTAWREKEGEQRDVRPPLPRARRPRPRPRPRPY